MHTAGVLGAVLEGRDSGRKSVVEVHSVQAESRLQKTDSNLEAAEHLSDPPEAIRVRYEDSRKDHDES